jgi:FAD binding domain
MTTSIHDPARAALEAGVSGPVLFAGDPRIDHELAGFNLAVRHEPHVVVGATNAADVAAAVRYAARRGLAVGIHATGHGGYASRDTVIVSTHRMLACSVDPALATATVQAGVPWSMVISAAAPHGLAPLSGSASSVGAIGYTVGGGAGPIIRSHGFAADHVTSLQLVTADGQVRVVDAEHDPDLFWAVRGGKANFGVVTQMTTRLVRLPTLYAGAVYFPGEQAAELLHGWRAWVDTLDERTSSSIALVRLPDRPHVPAPLRGRLTVHLRFAHTGDAESGRATLEPMLRLAPPLIDAVREMPYSDVDSIHNDPTEPLPAWSRGSFLSGLPAAALDRLLDQAGPGVESPLVVVELRHLGGAASRHPDPDNSVAGRDAPFVVNAVGPLFPPIAEIVPTVGQRLLDALAPWSTGQEPVNFSGGPRTPGDGISAWPVAIRERLLEVKRRHDPDNVFRTGFALLAAGA